MEMWRLRMANNLSLRQNGTHMFCPWFLRKRGIKVRRVCDNQNTPMSIVILTRQGK